MSSTNSSVQQARQALADRMREIRLRAVDPERMTTTRLANLAGWHQTKVSKLEHCVTSFTVEDIRIWCVLCGVGDRETEDLVATALSVASAYMEWKRRRRQGMKRVQQSYVPLWERTKRFRIYEASVIPGLFQTPGYARAVLRAVVRFNQIPDEVDEAVEARMERRRVVSEGSGTFAVLVEEAALYTRYGSDNQAIAEQLAYLLTIMSRTNVSLGIIPQDADRSTIWPVNGFWIYDSDRVITELLTAEVTITQPTEVETYERAYTELWSLAVRDDGAQRLIVRAIAALALCVAEHDVSGKLQRASSCCNTPPTLTSISSPFCGPPTSSSPSWAPAAAEGEGSFVFFTRLLPPGPGQQKREGEGL